jgi:hypothetical protein
MHRPIASALQVFVVLIFFSAGLFFFALPFLPEVRFYLSDFFLKGMEGSARVAIACWGMTLLFLIGFYGWNRGRFLYIEMGSHTAAVEETLIRHSIEECFKTHFPQTVQLSQIGILWGKKLSIEIAFSSKDLKKRKEFLASAEKHLQFLLRQRFGYVKPFSLICRI